ncbi:MAG: hypothetical protein V5B40_24805 [Candidatus Accumulibacter meliphilus]
MTSTRLQRRRFLRVAASSNTQIGKELGLNKDDVQKMATQLREGVVSRKPAPALQGTVECDEVYVVAGHKGHPLAVKKTP